LTAPDLPKKRIIADCYAATQPDTRLWKRYLAEIDKLEKSKNLTADDYYLLRHSIEAKSALMDLTRGEEDAFTAGTVPEILDLVHSRVKADLRSKLESESMARRDAEAKVLSAKAREEDRVLRINLRAQRFASVITKLLKPLLFILLSIGTISTFPWKLPSITLAPVRYVICAIQAVLLVLSVLNLMYGTALEAQLRKLELSLSRFVKNMLVALTE
jgi:hypothetical protein